MKKSEKLFGVPPESLPIHDKFIVHKSAKKGQTSFRITKTLLENLLSTSVKIQKKPQLIISIVDGSTEYYIHCEITKTNME